MSDNGGNSCPYALQGCSFKNLSYQVLMAHLDECPYNLKSNQSKFYGHYDINVKPPNLINKDAPTIDRPNQPFIQNQNAYLPHQQPQNTTAYSPVQQASIQTSAAASTYQQNLNQPHSYALSQFYVQELPIQTSATIPTNQQPQIQQYSYPSALPTVQQGLIQTKSATSTFKQHLDQQHSYPTQYSNMQQPPIQTYATITTQQQHSHARAYPTMQQVLVQTAETIPSHQQNQIQNRQYPLSYTPVQQVPIQNSGATPTFQHSSYPTLQQSQKLGNDPLITNQHLLIQKSGQNSYQIPNPLQQQADPAQSVPGHPIFDVPQQPGQPIFDFSQQTPRQPIFDMQYQTPNRIQVVPQQQKIQVQAPSPFAQIQQVQHFSADNESTQKQIDYLRSPITREFGTESKQQKTNFQYLNDYIQGAFLGKGSFGQVYECTRKSDRQKLAVKKILFNAQQADQIKTEAQQEYATMRSLQHPNLLRTQGYEEDQECCYIFMELASEDLNTFIQRAKANKTPLKENQVLHFAVQVLQGLKHLHSKNAIHRDVKPLNCLLINGINLKISDFGGARQLSNDLSFAMSYKGTQQYASPEILLRKPYQKSVDIWSFGVMLYELCTLNYPFPDIKDTKNPYFKFQPIDQQDYSQELRDLIKDCLTYDPSARPTVEQILDRHFLFEFSQDFDEQNRDLIWTQLMLLKQNAMKFPQRSDSYNELVDKILTQKITQNPQVNAQVPNDTIKQCQIKVEAEKFTDQLRLTKTFDLIQKAVNYTPHTKIQNKTVKIEGEVQRNQAKPSQLTQSQDFKNITQTNQLDLSFLAQVKKLSQPEKTNYLHEESGKMQKQFDLQPPFISQDVAQGEVKQIQVQQLKEEPNKKVQEPIQKLEDLVGQNYNQKAIDHQTRLNNNLKDPVLMGKVIHKQISEHEMLQQMKSTQLEEVTKQAHQAAQQNSKVVKIEEEPIKTMWQCPFCKAYMKLNEAVCIKCQFQIEYFQDELKIPLDSMVVELKLSEYEDILKKQAQNEAVSNQTYWMCPQGCTNNKIRFGDTCGCCDGYFIYFVTEKKLRKIEDLFQSEDQPLELWNCRKCKNHNIDTKKRCSKCGSNKKYQDQQEKAEMKDWYWDCYYCDYTNKRKRSKHCVGCSEVKRAKQKSFETEDDCKKKIKVEAPKQIESANPFKELVQHYLKPPPLGNDLKPPPFYLKPPLLDNDLKPPPFYLKPPPLVSDLKPPPIYLRPPPLVNDLKPPPIYLRPPPLVKPVEKNQGLQWQCICGQLNVEINGLIICQKCQRVKPPQEEKKIDFGKLPENTWMCKFCKVKNYSERWKKLKNAYCQNCKKFSEERNLQILVALSKQNSERQCQECKQNKSFKVDQISCDDCLQNHIGQVWPDTDVKPIVLQVDNIQREEKKSCVSCNVILKGNEKDGLCYLCLQKMQRINQRKKQEEQQQLLDCNRCGKRTRKSNELMCDSCAKGSQQN